MPSADTDENLPSISFTSLDGAIDEMSKMNSKANLNRRTIPRNKKNKNIKSIQFNESTQLF